MGISQIKGDLCKLRRYIGPRGRMIVGHQQALPNLGPKMWTFEQPLGEFGHRRPVLVDHHT